MWATKLNKLYKGIKLPGRRKCLVWKCFALGSATSLQHFCLMLGAVCSRINNHISSLVALPLVSPLMAVSYSDTYVLTSQGEVQGSNSGDITSHTRFSEVTLLPIPSQVLSVFPCQWPFHLSPANDHSTFPLPMTIPPFPCLWPFHLSPAYDHSTFPLPMTIPPFPCQWPFHLSPVNDHSTFPLSMTIPPFPCQWSFHLSPVNDHSTFPLPVTFAPLFYTYL